jgi:hypothetical protein
MKAGVEINPDIEVDAKNALKAAYKVALEKLISGANDETEIEKYQWALDGISAGNENVDVTNRKKVAVGIIPDGSGYRSEDITFCITGR